jgi:hypothetical protein
LRTILGFLTFIRWGTLYDCGDEEVQRGLCQFALQKLLCATPGDKIVLTEAQKYALLSQRLALDVNSTIYVPLTPDEAEKEHHQITNHMRIAVSIGDGIETLRGVASSEPLLSEAAFLVMSNRSAFKLAEVLATVLRGFSINIGDRAELLVSAFFTWARDSTVLMKCHEEFPGQLSRYFSVNELFSSLFSEAIFESMSQNGPSLCHAETSRRTFENVFHDTSMHFNHFIKPQEQKIMARHYLPWFMARGAAALGANCQPGIDAVYPYLRGSLELDVKNLGFILVQVKKDDVSTESRAEIFKKMDPFACGLLHESDKMNGHFPIPLIRVVFALCGKPEFVHMTYSSPSNGASSLADTGQPCFTSYDFWCSGISPDVLQPVKESPGMWLALAGQLDSWQKFYSSATDPDLLRSQLPCAASDTAHFNSFWEF